LLPTHSHHHQRSQPCQHMAIAAIIGHCLCRSSVPSAAQYSTTLTSSLS
jgi:hypothetical protein